jgi:hypothetical protein
MKLCGQFLEVREVAWRMAVVTVNQSDSLKSARQCSDWILLELHRPEVEDADRY